MTKKIVAIKPRVEFADIKKLMDGHRVAIDALADSFDQGNQKQSMLLLSQVYDIGVSWTKYARFGSIALGELFRLYRIKWEKLPLEFRQSYTDCYDYIQQVYGYGSQMVDMYATVWEALFSGKYITKVPSYVDLMGTSIVRMRIAAPFIMNKEMTPKRWKLMADKTIRTDQFRYLIKDKTKVNSTKAPRKKSEIQFVRSTGDLRMFVDGNYEQVGFLNIASTNVTVIEKINDILKSAGVKEV